MPVDNRLRIPTLITLVNGQAQRLSSNSLPLVIDTKTHTQDFLLAFTQYFHTY